MLDNNKTKILYEIIDIISKLNKDELNINKLNFYLLKKDYFKPLKKKIEYQEKLNYIELRNNLFNNLQNEKDEKDTILLYLNNLLLLPKFQKYTK